MLDGLDDDLAALGFTPFDIQLPGRPANVAPLEGSLRLTAAPEGFIFESVDYGRSWILGRADTEAEAKALVLDYVSRPLPPVTVLSGDQLDELVNAVSVHYFDLRDRAALGSIVIDLPPRLPLDRIGALDGFLLFPLDTPLELRSLPPTVLRPESEVHRLLTATTVRVGASIVPPWFGQPGGGLRFELQDAGVGIRDLVVAGALERIHVAG